MRPKLNSLAPIKSLPLTANSPLESIEGRKRCVSSPSPLAEGMAFCAQARGVAQKQAASTAAPTCLDHVAAEPRTCRLALTGRA